MPCELEQSGKPCQLLLLKVLEAFLCSHFLSSLLFDSLCLLWILTECNVRPTAAMLIFGTI